MFKGGFLLETIDTLVKKKRKNKVGVATQLCQHTFNLKKKFKFISKLGLGSVRAARKVSPNYSQEK